jgi:hypothetical protein
LGGQSRDQRGDFSRQSDRAMDSNSTYSPPSRSHVVGEHCRTIRIGCCGALELVRGPSFHVALFHVGSEWRLPDQLGRRWHGHHRPHWRDRIPGNGWQRKVLPLCPRRRRERQPICS